MIPRAFCEFPAGLASVSLRLHGGPGCRPPISRMGNKAGYAETILWTLGLTAGKSAGAYVWAEADDDVRALLRAYPDPALLLRVAEIIRGWADEEPRALWERLRAERKAWIATETGALAGSVLEAGWSYRQGCLDTGYAGPDRRHTATATATASLAEFAMLASSNRLISVAGPELRNTGKGGTTFGGAEFATPAGEVAGSFEEVAGAVAAHSFLHQGSFGYKGPDAGIGRPEGMEAHETHGSVRPVSAILGDSFPRIVSNWPPVAVLPRIPSADMLSAMLGTPGDLDGCVVYMDGPYENTTRYLHQLPRAEQVRIALDMDRLGAVVAVSEAVPVVELTALGWRAVDLTGGRKGQKRTFARVATEALTMNRKPRYVVPEQAALFAIAMQDGRRT